MTPRIGLTGITRAVAGVDRTGVNAAYVRSVVRAGGLPLILSPLLDPGHYQATLDLLDGLVLTGGEDIDPAHFGEPPHPKLGAVDPARDRLELGLFRGAQTRGIPTLAICRGIQVVNVALGGSLWQDLPSQRPGPVAHTQTEGRAERSHVVRIQPRARLAAALGAETLTVNSFHHQAIRDLAPGLLATAWAEDGLIEGAESAAAAPWLLAVQWHPEEFHTAELAPDHGLFGALLAAARGFAASRATVTLEH